LVNAKENNQEQLVAHTRKSPTYSHWESLGKQAPYKGGGNSTLEGNIKKKKWEKNLIQRAFIFLSIKKTKANGWVVRKSEARV